MEFARACEVLTATEHKRYKIYKLQEEMYADFVDSAPINIVKLLWYNRSQLDGGHLSRTGLDVVLFLCN